MKLIIQFPLVAEGLLDEVAAVGGRIDQDVVRPGLHTTLDDRLQKFVLNLEILKGKVIHVNDKLVITVLHLLQNRGQCMELMLINFYNTQSLTIVCI